LTNKNVTGLVGSIALPLDASVATGTEVASYMGALTMWVVARGYGAGSGKITRFKLD